MDEGREARLRAAVGPRANYYLPRWKAMEETGRTASWNWAACFLNVFWMAFRKMWLALVLFLAANVAIALLGAAVPVINRYITLPIVALSFVSGTWGNLWYRWKAERLVAATEGMDEGAAAERLRRQGGTSPLALAVALALTLAGAALVVRQALLQLGAGQVAPKRL